MIVHLKLILSVNKLFKLKVERTLVGMKSSTTCSAGANVSQAMGYLHRAGLTPERVAADLGITTRTAKRWEAGTQRPNSRNFTALRTLATDARWEATRKTHTSRLERHREQLLFEALTALETTAERARVAELRARLNQPAPKRSVYADVDPFVLACANAEPAYPF